MTTPVFPTLSTGADSKYYSLEVEDLSIQSPMDGGYIVSRARTTRAPRITFTTGYTQLSNADMQAIQSFYASVCGGSVIFNWLDPVTRNVYQVRFMDKKLNFKYTGMGYNQMWDVQFTLTQA